ncbi:MAG: hypothetical protein H0T45_05000 [Pyrinomonadaceae bacterium]|nr:hypothetical protein [Pyrinomonadaceae bacterium]
MKERERDDITIEPPSAPREPEREPGSYYYDDGTGYELFDPTDERDEEEGTTARQTIQEHAGIHAHRRHIKRRLLAGSRRRGRR